MKTLATFALALSLLLALPCPVATAQGNSNANSNLNSTTTNTNSNKNKRRGPVFRANKDQVTQAQTMLTQRGFYNGEATGKLNPDTRAALKKYQQAESLNVTGTLNRATLEKMNITLTERQKSM